MFQSRNLALILAPLLGSFTSSPLAAQSSPLNLRPGDVVIADTATFTDAAIRILRSNGTVDVVLSSNPLMIPGGVLIDRDGAILVSNWQWQFSNLNGVYRLDPAGGAVTMLNNQPLADNFALVRDANGDLVVADGFAGLARINQYGDVSWYSTPGSSYEVSLGVDLDYDGNILLAESYNYAGGAPAPGSIFSVDSDGNRTLIAQDENLLYSPNDLALAPNGGIVATNYHQANPINDDPRLVYVQRNGTVTALADNGIMQKPKGVHVSEWGEILVADTDEQAVLRYVPGLGMEHVLWDMADGVDDGNPVNRPFAVDQVPSLWLRTELTATAGRNSHVAVSGIPSYWGQSMTLAISLNQTRTPMNGIWSNSLRTSHVGLGTAKFVRGILPINGSDWHYTGFVPTALAGTALHLQVVLTSPELLSNYVALPVL